jgi:hypothetical protein
VTFDVESLPRRTAHAAYALVAAARDYHGPPTAYEVCLYDPEALSVRSTGQALRNCARLGLCFNTKGIWWPTNDAYELHSALENRFLRETEDE